MSTFLYHEPCPKCGSKDNVGVWDDGHKWCFSACGFYVPPTSELADVERKLKPLVTTEGSNSNVQIPEDFTFYIPAEPRRWLAKYELTEEEIKHHKIGWSPSNQMLIFLYYGDENDLLMWQGRYFPERVPKVFTSGYPDRNLILVRSYKPAAYGVVVVEDPVSAIKVSRVCDSHPLFGSNLSQQKVIRLSRYYRNLFLWLDNDKVKEMMKFKSKYTHFFDSVKIIVTEQDPKFYNEAQIKEFVNG